MFLSIMEIITHDDTFSVTLMKLIKAKGMTGAEVYKRANIERKLFSKIRCEKNYMPSKKTAISLALSLELSLEETNYLLKRAGFALSSSLPFDIVIESFISQRKYNIYEINSALFERGLPTLSGK